MEVEDEGFEVLDFGGVVGGVVGYYVDEFEVV